jgi:hypothetical protein
MSTPRTWLLIIALVILALGSGFYLFSPMRQSKTSATESPATIMTKSPVATPLSEENLPGPTPESQPPFTSAAPVHPPTSTMPKASFSQSATETAPSIPTGTTPTAIKSAKQTRPGEPRPTFMTINTTRSASSIPREGLPTPIYPLASRIPTKVIIEFAPDMASKLFGILGGIRACTA